MRVRAPILCPVLLFLLLAGLHCGHKSPNISTRFALSRLQEDFQHLKHLVYRSHPMTFTDRVELEAAFDRQSAMLEDNLTVLDFYRITIPAVAMLRCGHTELSVPAGIQQHFYASGNFLPFDIVIIHDSLFVYRSFANAPGIKPGSLIQSINGIPAAGILNRLRSSIPSDGQNQAKKDFLLNQSFGEYFLRFIDGTPSFEIEYADIAGGAGSKTEAIGAKAWSDIRALQVHDSCQWELERIGTSLAGDSAYAILTIPSFEYGDERERFVQAVDSFFATVSEKHIRALILDLRGNQGGDAYSAAYLLGYLLREPFRYFAPSSTHLHGDLKGVQPIHENRFTGRLYVLIDGGCCSTAGHLVSLLKYHGVGTFVGTETGGSYICHGGFSEHDLPNTRLHLLLPQATFIADVNGHPKARGIHPDHLVEPSIVDMLDCRDRAMDSVKSLICAAYGATAQ